jgi:hypothetical protein
MTRRRRQERASAEPDPAARDFVIARLGIARTEAQAAIDEIDDALALFADPDDDSKGKARDEAVTEALERLGRASRAAEAAEEKLDAYDPEASEPWDEEEESDA